MLTIVQVSFIGSFYRFEKTVEDMETFQVILLVSSILDRFDRDCVLVHLPVSLDRPRQIEYERHRLHYLVDQRYPHCLDPIAEEKW